jgi:hypothetical protein
MYKLLASIVNCGAEYFIFENDGAEISLAISGSISGDPHLSSLVPISSFVVGVWQPLSYLIQMLSKKE